MNLFCTTLIAITLSVTIGVGAAAQQNKPDKLPAGYRYIGTYKMASKITVERGESMPVVITPLIYRVYSDGIDVRVYCRSAGEDSFTSYQIYRSDGIGVTRTTGEIDLIAGVQKTGRIVRCHGFPGAERAPS